MLDEPFHPASKEAEQASFDENSDVSSKASIGEKVNQSEHTSQHYSKESEKKSTTARLGEQLGIKNVVEDSEDPIIKELCALPVQELARRLKEANANAQASFERALRTQAEADNLAKRVERDIVNAHKFALEKFVNALLPIVDSLELCVHSASAIGQAEKAILDGVKLTLKMFQDTLEKFNIKQIDPLSQPFNPEYHQATAMQIDASLPAGTVLSVLQKGYLLSGRLIRPALVVVSKREESVEKQ